MNRRHFLFSIITVAATACGAQATSTASPIVLAKDKPTLLYFWTPN